MSTDEEMQAAIRGIYKMAPDIKRITGKEVDDCTAEDLQYVSQTLRLEAAAMVAEADQASMVLREAARCGCQQIAMPAGDIARAFVVHTCGGAS